MFKQTRRFVAVVALAGMACATSVSAQAAPAPTQQQNSTALWFENWVGLNHATLKVVAPSGKVMSVYSETGTPVFQLQGHDFGDGIYHYELTAATTEKIAVDPEVNNGRGPDAPTTSFKPYKTSGQFTVDHGAIISPDMVAEPVEQ